MRKNYIIPLLGILTLFLMQACYGDEGNYDYRSKDDVINVKVNEIEEASYGQLSEVTIIPDISFKNNTTEDDYEYLWYAFMDGVNQAGAADTLGKTKDLHFTMTLPLNTTYKLIYKVTEKKTGIAVKTITKVTAVSAISKGWFILKDDGDMTDIDIILPDGVLLENALSKSLGEKMPGKALDILFQPKYYHMAEDGTLKSDKQVYHVFSDKDFRTLDVADLFQMKNFEEEFYLPPNRNRPQAISVGSQVGSMYAIMIINDGSAHTFEGMMKHTSQFSSEKLGSSNLYPSMIPFIFGTINALVYDMTENRFMFASSRDVNLIESPLSPDPTALDPRDTKMDMIWMGVGTRSPLMPVTGWALMSPVEAGSTDTYLVRLIAEKEPTYPITSVTKLDPLKGLLSAELRTGFNRGDYLYFSKANVLSFYHHASATDDSQNTETVAFTFPEGETITQITHREQYNFIDSNFNKLTVLTSIGDSWKLYVFDFTNEFSPDLKAKDKEYEVFTGKGIARQALFRSGLPVD